MPIRDDTIAATIAASVNSLILRPEFEEWRSGQSWNHRDFCVLNSSFVLRDGVKTNQSSWRLVLSVNRADKLTLVGAAEFDNIRSPFKRMAAQSSNLPQVVPLAEAVRNQARLLGEVVFSLIGDLAPSAEGVVEISSLPGVSSIRLDTSQAAAAVIQDSSIIVNETEDEEAIWAAVGTQLGDGELRPKLAKALEDLEDVALRNVVVPPVGTAPRTPLLAELSSGLEMQALEYQEALERWVQSGRADDNELYQILRISYNFASNAVRLIRLIVSVCDLKPIVFWCTVKEHLALDTAIKALPWQTHSKASLGTYEKIVNVARNHAFHDLFPLISGLNVELPDAALRKVRLRLFARHGSRKNPNEVRFEDQELVDLLTEFTRSGRRLTPPDFWEQNLATMQASLDLLEATTRALVLLRSGSD